VPQASLALTLRIPPGHDVANVRWRRTVCGTP
jgi:hypothetical protein